MICPRCHKPICDCLLEDPGYLARAVGKQLGQLGEARRLNTQKVNGAKKTVYDPSLQNTETPPSLCRWIRDRLSAAGVRPKTILDPCAGRGNLTRPFHAKVVEYEIERGWNFFDVKKRIACDLALCNPPWKEAERWLRHVVEIVGNRTPIVFICPLLFFAGYKDAPVRKYLESDEAPTLNHITPLPSDTFVRVYCAGAVLWLNLPTVKNVALVPSNSLVRKNDWELENDQLWNAPAATN